VEFPTVQHSDDLAVYSIIFFAGDAPLNDDHQHSDDESDTDPLISRPRNDRKIDPELDMENLCEIKHNMMTRNARAMDIDRRLQPNPAIRDTLEIIIKVYCHNTGTFLLIYIIIKVSQLSTYANGRTRFDMEISILVKI
jgi:hypothetical protein